MYILLLFFSKCVCNPPRKLLSLGVTTHTQTCTKGLCVNARSEICIMSLLLAFDEKSHQSEFNVYMRRSVNKG